MSQTTLKRLPVVFLPLIFALLPHARGWNETVHLDSPALAGNKIGNPTRRRVFIYLPPGYERDSDRYYPTLYVLHGWGGDDKIGQTVSDIADKLILDGEIKPMILAAPDTKGKTYYRHLLYQFQSEWSLGGFYYPGSGPICGAQLSGRAAKSESRHHGRIYGWLRCH